MKNFIGKGDFTWFFGVVEDRDDPVQLGRVRVRCYGYHTDDKAQIPTESLPWAIPVNPVQSASVSGVGHSPTGLVEGSWVVGFFIDGDRAQEPIILGSLYGAPLNFAEPTMGFNDPTGIYPRATNETDVSRAAREDADNHFSRITKSAGRLDKDGNPKTYATATPPRVSSVAEDKEDAYYADVTWQEPFVSGNTTPEYTQNHVRETESGHLEEFDDTEGARRYHRFHPAGSFEEIIDDGSRTIKVVGEDYEMYLNGKNIYIDGNVNMTVTGDKRELVQGNYHLEVEGDMTMDFKQSWQTKVGFNQETEVVKSRSTNVGQNDNLTVVEGDQSLNIITGSRNETIATDDVRIVQGKLSATSYGDYSLFTTGDYKLVTTQSFTETAKGNITRYTSANETVTVSGNKTLSAANESTSVSGTITTSAANETTTISGTKTETAGTGNVSYSGGDIGIGSISFSNHRHPGDSGGTTGVPF